MSEKTVQFNEKIINRQIKEFVRDSVEETLAEIHLASVSVHPVENITEALWGSNALHHRRAKQESLYPYCVLAQPRPFFAWCDEGTTWSYCGATYNT